MISGYSFLGKLAQRERERAREREREIRVLEHSAWCCLSSGGVLFLGLFQSYIYIYRVLHKCGSPFVLLGVILKVRISKAYACFSLVLFQKGLHMEMRTLVVSFLEEIHRTAELRRLFQRSGIKVFFKQYRKHPSPGKLFQAGTRSRGSPLFGVLLGCSAS